MHVNKSWIFLFSSANISVKVIPCDYPVYNVIGIMIENLRIDEGTYTEYMHNQNVN